MFIRNGKCSIEDESVRDMQNILAQDDEEIDDKDKKDEEDEDDIDVKDLEDEEDKDEDKDKDEEENNENDEDKENKDKLDTKNNLEIPKFKEITKKYPNFFKDFPDYRHIHFHAKQYREMFPTVDDAKEAVEQLETFNTLQESLTKGTPEDIADVLKSIKDLSDDAISNLSTNFLSSIRKMDQSLYFQVITPELVNLTRSVFNAGVRDENDNLKNAAYVVAKHLFGNPEVASGKAEVKLPTKQVAKDNALENERKSFKQERYKTFHNDVVTESDTRLDSLIMDGIDPKNNLTKGMKSVITKRVAEEIGNILEKDSVYMARMNSLWRKAGNDNFITAHRSKIVNAYIERAKDLIPKVRSRVKSEILGTRDRHSDDRTPGGNGTGRRIEPPNNAGGGGSRNSQRGKDLNPKQIDYRKTSDMDILRDNVTLKN